METKEPGENLPLWILCNEKEQCRNMTGQIFDLLSIQIWEQLIHRTRNRLNGIFKWSL